MLIKSTNLLLDLLRQGICCNTTNQSRLQQVQQLFSLLSNDFLRNILRPAFLHHPFPRSRFRKTLLVRLFLDEVLETSDLSGRGFFFLHTGRVESGSSERSAFLFRKIIVFWATFARGTRPVGNRCHEGQVGLVAIGMFFFLSSPFTSS